MNSLPRALDLFSGAGGASMGLYMAGFDVTGVDIEDQSHYPPFLKFIQADAISFPLRGYDFIWASPICQKHTQLNYLHRSRKYQDFIPLMRKRLAASGIPWVIENVPNAPLARGALLLCGTERVADVVLNYRPKSKQPKPRKRKKSKRKVA